MTQVNWRRPLALAAALFALAALTYWLEYSHKPQKEEREQEAKKVLALKDEPISAIRIVDGSKAYAFRCLDLAAKMCKAGDNSKWEAVEPIQLRADDANVNMLVSAITNLASTENIDLSDETPDKRAALLKEYRLDPDTRKSQGARRIEVTTGKGDKQVLYLGETHPIGDSIFAARGNVDTKVYLVPSYFKGNFDHDLTYWRDKKLLTVAAHEIDGFGLSGRKSQVSAERKDGQWQLKAKGKGNAIEEMPGDLEAVDNLLSAVTFLTAKGIPEENKDSPAAKKILRGTKPLLTMTLRPAQKADAKTPAAPIVLTLHEKPGKTPALYATVSSADPLYELEPAAKDRLEKTLPDLRMSRLITSMERFTAKRLSFTGASLGKEPLVLVNSDSKWQIQPDKKDANAEQVQDFLDKLSGARIQAFLTGKEIPTGEASGVTFTLGDEKNDKKRQIVFWKSGAEVYARDLLSKRPEVFMVDSSIGGALPSTRDFFSAKPAKNAEAKAPKKVKTLPKAAK